MCSLRYIAVFCEKGQGTRTRSLFLLSCSMVFASWSLQGIPWSVLEQEKSPRGMLWVLPPCLWVLFYMCSSLFWRPVPLPTKEGVVAFSANRLAFCVSLKCHCTLVPSIMHFQTNFDLMSYLIYLLVHQK